MIKKTIAIVVIFLASGAWLYLDCLTRQEKNMTAFMHQSLDQTRAEGKKRAEAKAIFENQILANLNNCNDAAEKANSAYMKLVEELAPRKRKQAVIPPAIISESEKTLAVARLECQLAYDKRAESGI